MWTSPAPSTGGTPIADRAIVHILGPFPLPRLRPLFPKAVPLALLLFAVVACARGRVVGLRGGGGSAVPPPAGAAEAPLLPTLVAVAPSENAARVDFVLPDADYEAALFHATQRADVYAGAPVVAPLTGTAVTVPGLAPGEHFFGLGVRRVNGNDPYTPTGATLRCRVAGIIYVDAASTAVAPDGTTPATAFPRLGDGLLAAAVLGRNVLVRGGTYAAVSLTLVNGVQVYGGFDAGFDLGGREVVAHASVLEGGAGQPMLVVGDASPAAVIDGLFLDGLGVATFGIDSQNASFDVHATTVRRCFERGVRARSAARTGGYRLRLAACRFAENRTDGVSVSGPFDIELHGCNLDANGEEGIDIDDMVALEGTTANLVVEGSRFFGNGAEGLDCDLAAPPNPVAPGGVFDVRIRGCRFELNAMDGLLVDLDFELVPDWRAHVLVRECVARGNQLAGVHIDADATGDVTLQRLSCTANGTDGVLATSETGGGVVTLASSVLMGNGGAGARAAQGNKVLALSHCVIAANFGGGVVSERVASSATACVAYLQDAAFAGTSPFAGGETRATDTFLAAPGRFLQVTARNAATFTLARPEALPTQASLELADDRVPRTATLISGADVTLDPAPGAARLPSVLTVFEARAPVWEDFHLAPASPLIGTGFTPPGGGVTDPGVWGAPAPGHPGIGDVIATPAPFRVLATIPADLRAHPTAQPIQIVFSEDLDAATLAGNVLVRTNAGLALAVSVSANANTLTLAPPNGGFGTVPITIELHRGLLSAAAVPLAAPLVLPVTILP